MTKQYIIINDTLNILNARREIVYQFQKGERVEIEATTKWYWCTRHGAVWFSQAKSEAEIERRKAKEALFLTFFLATMVGRV